MTTSPNPRGSSRRWTQDSIRTARTGLYARITEILSYSDAQLRAHMTRDLGVTPHTTVSHDALRRWMIQLALDAHLPDSPPKDPH